jgi:hypothetical protein
LRRVFVVLVIYFLARLGHGLLPRRDRRSEHLIALFGAVVVAVLDREFERFLAWLGPDDCFDLVEFAGRFRVACIRVIWAEGFEFLEEVGAQISAVVLIVFVADRDGVVGEEYSGGGDSGCGWCTAVDGSGRAGGRVGDAADECTGVAVGGVDL